jgi:hypothetical protein
VPLEAPFFISIAGLSASLAGLAGLVAAIRRGEGLAPNDRFRLREIVEFAFANIFFAMGIFPLTALVGDLGSALLVAAAAVAIYLVIDVFVLTERRIRMRIALRGRWIAVVALLNLAAFVLAGITVATRSVGAYEAVLLALLARPMLSFALVLSSFERGPERD